MIRRTKMITKKKKSNFGVVIGEEEIDVLDNPEEGAPKACQISPGRKVKILSEPNKKYYGIGITKSVVGFVLKKNIKVE